MNAKTTGFYNFLDRRIRYGHCQEIETRSQNCGITDCDFRYVLPRNKLYLNKSTSEMTQWCRM